MDGGAGSGDFQFAASIFSSPGRGVNMSLGAGLLYIDDDEITPEAGDRLQASANTANAVQYLISGVERDV